MRKINRFTLLLLLLPILGCNNSVPAVGRLEVQPRSLRLPFPELATLHLTWNPTGPLGTEAGGKPTVFVHLLGSNAQLLRTFDHEFPQQWVEGAVVSYNLKIYQSLLAPPLEAGRYRLSIGLYDRGGKRWPLAGLGQEIGRREYLGAEVEVPAQTDQPQLTFSSTWLPTTAGTDRQVVARRWLSGQPGTIQASNFHAPGTLWLMIRIPAGDGPNEKLVLTGGASNAPSVEVRSACGSVDAGISGSAPHEIEIPFDGTAAGCTIEMTPNFQVTSPDPPRQRSVSLENVAWIPGPPRGAAPPEPSNPTPPQPGGQAQGPAATPSSR